MQNLKKHSTLLLTATLVSAIVFFALHAIAANTEEHEHGPVAVMVLLNNRTSRTHIETMKTVIMITTNTLLKSQRTIKIIQGTITQKKKRTTMKGIQKAATMDMVNMMIPSTLIRKVKSLSI